MRSILKAICILLLFSACQNKDYLIVERDDFNEFETYWHRIYFEDIGTNLYPYITKTANKLNMGFNVIYLSEKAINLDKCLIKADSSFFTSKGEALKVELDGGSMRETLITYGGYNQEKEIEIMKAIASAKSVKVRFSGSEYQEQRVEDIELSKAEIKAFGTFLKAYENLKQGKAVEAKEFN